MLTLESKSNIMEIAYLLDEEFGERLMISDKADQSELHSNIRAARSILASYNDVYIRINPHSYSIGVKNPEYTINENLGDRKGVMSEMGITAGFKSAKKQGCKVVVIDLDEHSVGVDSFQLSKYISRRKQDFVRGMILSCYVVCGGGAVRVNAATQTRMEIEHEMEILKP